MTAVVIWRGEVLALLVVIAVVMFVAGFNAGWRARQATRRER